MTFELWLFAEKQLGQTYDAAMTIFSQLPDDEKKRLRKEYDASKNN